MFWLLKKESCKKNNPQRTVSTHGWVPEIMHLYSFRICSLNDCHNPTSYRQVGLVRIIKTVKANHNPRNRAHVVNFKENVWQKYIFSVTCKKNKIK